MVKRIGFVDPRIFNDARIQIENPQVEARVGNIQFFSVIFRLFKVANLEQNHEDYGQAVIYKGSHQSPYRFYLDSKHIFEDRKVVPVSGNTFKILKESRFSSFFDFIGDTENHFGSFNENPLLGNNVNSICC